MKKVIAAAIISPVLIALCLFGVVACGSPASNATVDQQAPAKTQLEVENEMGLQYNAFAKKMQSGKTVECIGKYTAVTCDFEHAK